MKNKILIFPIVVIAFSMKSLIYTIGIPNYFSIFISILGLLGAFLFIKNKKSTNHLLELWLIGQIPFITKTIFATKNGNEIIKPIIEASQGVNLPISFNLATEDSILYLGINFLPIVIIGILKYLKLPYQKSNH